MLAVETDGFLVTGAGEIDLRNEKLDLKLGLHSGKASPTQPGGAGFRVGGTFLHPVFNVGPAGDRAGQEHPSPACITAVRGKTSSFGTVDRLSDHW